MKKSFKIILWSVLIISVCIIAAVNASKPLALTTVTLEKQSAEVYFLEQGIVSSKDITDVYPLVSGEITSSFVSDNQRVNNGDILFQIDTSEFETEIRQINSSTKSYMAQKSDLNTQEQRRRDELNTSRQNLINELEKAAAQFESSETTLTGQEDLQLLIIGQLEKDLAYKMEQYEKINSLYSAGVLQKSDTDEALNEVHALEASLSEARQELEIMKLSDEAVNFSITQKSIQAQIDYIDASLNKNYNTSMLSYYDALIEGNEALLTLLNKKIADCTVTAPNTGIAKDVAGKIKNVASPSNRLLTIVNDYDTVIECYISVRDLNECHVGDTVGLTLKQRTKDIIFDGLIDTVAKTAEIRTSSLGIEERRVKVEISPNIPDGVTILDGSELDVKFTVYKEDGKLLVPKTAIFEYDGRDMVWTINDGVLKMAEISKGVETRTDYVVEGLSEGDLVLKDANTEGLKEGRKAVSL